MKARLFTSDAMVEKTGIEKETILESEWFQITYNLLRSAPDGDPVARYDPHRDAWYLSSADGTAYSDVIFDPASEEV